jgi:mycoredoxin
MAQVEVYGTDWCEETCRVREQLDRRGVPYRYVNVSRDRQAEAWLRGRYHGWLRTPTIRVGEQVIAAPSEAELRGLG